MNQVNLIGMVYGDPIIRQSQNGKKVVNFTLSVPRSYDKKHFDFVSCRAWERVADIVEKWYRVKDDLFYSDKTWGYDNIHRERKVIAWKEIEEPYKGETE